MNIPGLSAGTGPAALVLVGGVLYLFEERGLDLVLIIAGIALSLIWAARFK